MLSLLKSIPEIFRFDDAVYIVARIRTLNAANRTKKGVLSSPRNIAVGKKAISLLRHLLLLRPTARLSKKYKKAAAVSEPSSSCPQNLNALLITSLAGGKQEQTSLHTKGFFWKTVPYF